MFVCAGYLPHFNFPDVEDPSTPLAAALRECEVFCIAACCGMDAFDVRVEHLQRWSDRAPAGDLERARRDAQSAVAALRDAPESFYFLDCDHTRRDVTEWFGGICQALAAVKPRR